MAIDFRLYFISDSRLAPQQPLPQVFRKAAECGVRAFQIREKHLNVPELRDLTLSITNELTPFNVRIFLNTHEQLASELAVNLQLPEDQISNIRRIRKGGGVKIIGASTHSKQSALLAQEQGADFILFGPVFETESKKRYGAPQGVAVLKELCQSVTLPVFAVGGITPENARQCIDAGAHGVACIGALMRSPDIGDTIGRFKLALGEL